MKAQEIIKAAESIGAQISILDDQLIITLKARGYKAAATKLADALCVAAEPDEKRNDKPFWIIGGVAVVIGHCPQIRSEYRITINMDDLDADAPEIAEDVKAAEAEETPCAEATGTQDVIRTTKSMSVRDFVDTYGPEATGNETLPLAVCEDGATISIQNPRGIHRFGHFTVDISCEPTSTLRRCDNGACNLKGRETWRNYVGVDRERADDLLSQHRWIVGIVENPECPQDDVDADDVCAELTPEDKAQQDAMISAATAGLPGVLSEMLTEAEPSEADRLRAELAVVKAENEALKAALNTHNTDTWSFTRELECAGAISKALNSNFKNYRLDIAQTLRDLEAYPMDRVRGIVARHLRTNRRDGNINRVNLEWADDVPAGSDDPRFERVTIHQAHMCQIDSLARALRERETETA